MSPATSSQKPHSKNGFKREEANVMKRGITNVLGPAILCLILLNLTSLSAAARSNSVMQITPSDDAFVSKEVSDGASPTISVCPASITRSYLKFPLSAIPDNAFIISASLNLFHSDGTGRTAPIDVHRVSVDWSEGTITWNNQPGYAATKTSSLSFNPSDNGRWRSWDITSDIDSAALSDGWISWCVKYRNEGIDYSGPYLVFYSKDNSFFGGPAPYLEIAYNVSPSLSDGLVTPTTSGWGTSFTYEITYTDDDNDLPLTYPRLFIDKETTGRTMTEKDPADQDTVDGKVYKYILETASENMGIHNFYFYVEDPIHGFSARYPQMGALDGPTVTKQRPILTCSVDNNNPNPRQTITFSGYLKDSKGFALPQRTVHLYMDESDTGSTAVTDDSGFYSISTTVPENRGSFSYKVHFTKEALYSSAKSSDVLVSTELPEISEIPLFWIVGIVVVVAVCVGILILIKTGKLFW